MCENDPRNHPPFNNEQWRAYVSNLGVMQQRRNRAILVETWRQLQDERR